MPPSPTKTSPSIKTPTYSSMHGRKGTYFTVALLILSLIAGMLGATTTIASISIEYIRVYLAIIISARVNIIR